MSGQLSEQVSGQVSEEEKYIIKTLKGSINTYIEGTKVTKVQLTTKEAEILLNLIEKLQQELEQEKLNNKQLKNTIEKGYKSYIELQQELEYRELQFFNNKNRWE